MTREQAIRKVLACLRLAGSSNPTEAATALRHARALMERHGLTEAEAGAAEVGTHQAATGFRGGELPQSLVALSRLIADGYRCQAVVTHVRRPVVREGCLAVAGSTAVQFVGIGADPEIAAYAFTVLRRQLQRDKARHVARCRKRASKQQRSEEFAIGWVLAIARLFPRAELPEARLQAIGYVVRQQMGATETTSGKAPAKPNRDSERDRHAGYAAGSCARLHQGLAKQQKALEAIP